MPTPLESLIQSGTKLWLDSVDPDLVRANRKLGATGATSNPIIIADLVRSGRFDETLADLFRQGLDDEAVAWKMTDKLVQDAQESFIDVYRDTKGSDGYVSFELDPLLEDPDCPLSLTEKAKRYVELGKSWATGHENRMIKVPATDAGLAALEDLVAAGVTVNVTLIFTDRQYRAARDAVWRGAQKRPSLEDFKSVYSIFISRIDVYTKKHLPELSPDAQGQVGLTNVKRLWTENRTFWNDKATPLAQEIIFASTGVKDPNEPGDKYVDALAGSDIQTNPPATNEAVQAMKGKTFHKKVDEMPPQRVLDEIDEKVDFAKLEKTLMEEGVKKFADPHKELLALLAQKRSSLGG